MNHWLIETFCVLAKCWCFQGWASIPDFCWKMDNQQRYLTPINHKTVRLIVKIVKFIFSHLFA